MNSIIDVHQLSKQYVLTKGKPYHTLRDNLTEMLQHPLSIFGSGRLNTVWVLKDLNFQVQEGEILGILGNNGAGKSTLLKILSRVTPPTTGEVTVRGRIGSLLEVGTGFHPELSGRENIYLNGAILGMTKKEVKSQFDTIVQFAEVEKFLDTPMKHYSSGMYMRLAFAVAAHLQSEIILVDEVLAVGDVEFQKKCLGKMGDIAQQGRTILFVSHNMGAVQQLCSRCIVLEKGSLTYAGPTEKAISKYLARSQVTGLKGNLKDLPRGHNVTQTARLEKISLLHGDGSQSDSTIDSEKPFTIELTLSAKEQLKTGVVITIKDENRRPVLLLSSGHLRSQDFVFKTGKNVITCAVATTKLASGRYSLDCSLQYPNREIVDQVEDALFFTVTNSDPYQIGFDYNQHWGVFHVDHHWAQLHRQ